MADQALSRELSQSVRGVRMRFLEQVEPHRADLYRFCRSLAGSVWDAEDLVQDTLLRAFAKLGEVSADVASPRSYLFAIAANAWTDRVRREAPGEIPAGHEVAFEEAQLAPEVREALASLVRALPPQERVAVLLKDVFDLSLEETAASLKTSVGAVKAALNRGRRRLAERGSEEPMTVSGRGEPDALVDAFVSAFNARDLDRLAGLFLEGSEARVVGMLHEHGRDQIRAGSLHHTLFLEEGDSRAERAVFRGETVLVLWYTHEGKRSVEDVWRLEAGEGGLRAADYYFFCPEVLEEIGRELGLPVRTNGHRLQPK
jgi:RNA polymerase sigma-70 factor (ECF subfamily)